MTDSSCSHCHVHIRDNIIIYNRNLIINEFIRFEVRNVVVPLIRNNRPTGPHVFSCTGNMVCSLKRLI